MHLFNQRRKENRFKLNFEKDSQVNKDNDEQIQKKTDSKQTNALKNAIKIQKAKICTHSTMLQNFECRDFSIICQAEAFKDVKEGSIIYIAQEDPKTKDGDSESKSALPLIFTFEKSFIQETLSIRDSIISQSTSIAKGCGLVFEKLKNGNFSHAEVSLTIQEAFDKNFFVGGNTKQQLYTSDIHCIDKSQNLHSVDLVFKNQLLNHRDNYVVTKDLLNKPFIVGQQIVSQGFDYEILSCKIEKKDLVDNKSEIKEAFSGFITKDTIINFRSQGSTNYLLVEFSEEMFECDKEGLLGFEKILKFFKKYLQKNDEFACMHEKNIVFFARIFYTEIVLKDCNPKVKLNKCNTKSSNEESSKFKPKENGSHKSNHFYNIQGINDIYCLMLSGNYDWNQFAGFQLNDQQEIFKDYLFSFKLPMNTTKDSAMKIFRENMLEFMDNLPLCRCEKSSIIKLGLFNKLSFKNETHKNIYNEFEKCSHDNSIKNQYNLQDHNKNLNNNLTEYELENCYTFKEFQKLPKQIISEVESDMALKKKRKASSLDQKTKKNSNNTRRHNYIKKKYNNDGEAQSENFESAVLSDEEVYNNKRSSIDKKNLIRKLKESQTDLTPCHQNRSEYVLVQNTNQKNDNECRINTLTEKKNKDTLKSSILSGFDETNILKEKSVHDTSKRVRNITDPIKCPDKSKQQGSNTKAGFFNKFSNMDIDEPELNDKNLEDIEYDLNMEKKYNSSILTLNLLENQTKVNVDEKQDSEVYTNYFETIKNQPMSFTNFNPIINSTSSRKHSYNKDDYSNNIRKSPLPNFLKSNYLDSEQHIKKKGRFDANCNDDCGCDLALNWKKNDKTRKLLGMISSSSKSCLFEVCTLVCDIKQKKKRNPNSMKYTGCNILMQSCGTGIYETEQYFLDNLEKCRTLLDTNLTLLTTNKVIRGDTIQFLVKNDNKENILKSPTDKHSRISLKTEMGHNTPNLDNFQDKRFTSKTPNRLRKHSEGNISEEDKIIAESKNSGYMSLNRSLQQKSTDDCLIYDCIYKFVIKKVGSNVEFGPFLSLQQFKRLMEDNTQAGKLSMKTTYWDLIQSYTGLSISDKWSESIKEYSNDQICNHFKNTMLTEKIAYKIEDVLKECKHHKHLAFIPCDKGSTYQMQLNENKEKRIKKANEWIPLYYLEDLIDKKKLLTGANSPKINKNISGDLLPKVFKESIMNLDDEININLNVDYDSISSSEHMVKRMSGHSIELRYNHKNSVDYNYLGSSNSEKDMSYNVSIDDQKSTFIYKDLEINNEKINNIINKDPVKQKYGLTEEIDLAFQTKNKNALSTDEAKSFTDTKKPQNQNSPKNNNNDLKEFKFPVSDSLNLMESNNIFCLPSDSVNKSTKINLLQSNSLDLDVQQSSNIFGLQLDNKVRLHSIYDVPYDTKEGSSKNMEIHQADYKKNSSDSLSDPQLKNNFDLPLGQEKYNNLNKPKGMQISHSLNNFKGIQTHGSGNLQFHTKKSLDGGSVYQAERKGVENTNQVAEKVKVKGKDEFWDRILRISVGPKTTDKQKVLSLNPKYWKNYKYDYLEENQTSKLELLIRARMVNGFNLNTTHSKNDKSAIMDRGNTIHSMMINNNFSNSVLHLHDFSEEVTMNIMNQEFEKCFKDNIYNFLYCFNWFDNYSSEFVTTYRKFFIQDEEWFNLDRYLSSDDKNEANCYQNFAFEFRIIIFSNYKCSEKMSQSERCTIEEKVTEDFEKFFVSFNEKIKQNVVNKKLEKVKRAFSYYNEDEKTQEFFEMNDKESYEKLLGVKSQKNNRQNKPNPSDEKIQKDNISNTKKLENNLIDDFEKKHVLSFKSEVISKEEHDQDDIQVEYPTYYNPKHAYVMKLSWLYASSYSIFVIINSIMKSVNLTNLTFKMGHNTFTDFKEEPDDKGYQPSIRFTFKERISFQKICILKKKFTEPKMNMGILHESCVKDKGCLVLGNTSKDLIIVINNECLRWISSSFFGNSEQTNEKSSSYEYNHVLKEIQSQVFPGQI